MLAEEIGQWMTGLSPGSRGRVAKSDQVIEGHSPKPLLGSPQTLGQHIEPVERGADRGRRRGRYEDLQRQRVSEMSYQAGNPKSGYRNPKQIPMQKLKWDTRLCLCRPTLSFFVFFIRISNFVFQLR